MIARLTRHTGALLVSNLGGAALSFALSALIGRALGQRGLGAYAVVMAWVFPLSLAVEFGLATLATREVARDERADRAYLDAMTRARLLLGGIAMLALIVAAPLLSRDADVVAGLIVSAPLVVILPFFSAFTAIFKARGAMWPIPWLNVGMLAVQAVWTAIAFLSGGGILAALIVNTLTSAGQLVAAWAIWRRRFYVADRGPSVAPRLADLLRLAWPFALAALFAAAQTRVNLILLDSLAGTADVGIYAAAGRFVEAARMLPNAFFGALFPALAALAAQPELLRQTFGRATIWLTVFGAAAVIGALLFGPALIRLVYGDGFEATVPVLAVLMAALGFSLLRGGRTLYWYALGREAQVNAVNGVVLALQVALGLWLIPHFGAVGAAWATLIVEAAGMALLWRELQLWPRRAVPEVDRYLASSAGGSKRSGYENQAP